VKKGILILVAVLALVGVMIMPLAALANTGTTTVSAEFVGPTITVTAPSDITFGTPLTLGGNLWSSLCTGNTPGSLVITAGSSGDIGGSVTAVASPTDWTGHMYTAGYASWLTEPLMIGDGDIAMVPAYIGFTYTAIPESGMSIGDTETTVLVLAVNQIITSSDTTPGIYYITITFTASAATP